MSYPNSRPYRQCIKEAYLSLWWKSAKELIQATGSPQGANLRPVTQKRLAKLLKYRMRARY